MPFSRLFRRKNRARKAASGGGSETSTGESALGNSDLLELQKLEQEGLEQEETPILDLLEGGLEEEELAAPVETRTALRDRAGDVDQETLAEGQTYQITAQDMAAGDADAIWRSIARNHGMSPEKLVPFNQHVVEVSFGFGSELQHTETTELQEGAEIYIPSAQELLFAECRTRVDSYDEALALYGEMKLGPNVALLDKARHRASGRIGEGYGTQGVDNGVFLSPNATLNGASARRSEEHGGSTEYRVMWLADFWKCSVFMHDVVFQAGYKPHQNPNNHYQLAGRLHESPMFREVDAKDARPGDCWQRFGGTRSNESHNAILSSFIHVEEVSGDTERWVFDIIGAESERAAESTREHDVEKGTNKTTDGKILRFFRPTQTL